MGCCGNMPLDDIYIPMNKRLLEYGKESYGELLGKKFPQTKIWIFTFYRDSEMCVECESKFSDMINWFNKYGFLEDPVNNVKWIIDDDIENNMILKDLAVKKTPLHLFCDSGGKIIDLIYGFPEITWLEKYILPIVRD